MRHGIPGGRFSGGLKGFFKAREADKKPIMRKSKRLPVFINEPVEDLEVIIVETLVEETEVEIEYPEVIDIVQPEDIITEEELAKEIQKAHRKKGRRKKRKK